MSNSQRRRPKGRNVPPRKPVAPQLMFKPGLTVMQIQHDDFCRTPDSQRDEDCHPLCSPRIVFIRPFDDQPDAEGQ